MNDTEGLSPEDYKWYIDRGALLMEQLAATEEKYRHLYIATALREAILRRTVGAREAEGWQLVARAAGLGLKQVDARADKVIHVAKKLLGSLSMEGIYSGELREAIREYEETKT